MNTNPKGKARTISALNRPALIIVVAGILAAAHLTGGTMSAASTPHAPIAGVQPAITVGR